METGADLHTDVDTQASTENASEADAEFFNVGDLIKKGKALASKHKGLISKGVGAAKNWWSGRKKQPAKKPPKIASVDCFQNFGMMPVLFTDTWNCSNGEWIMAEKVCDMTNDCTDSSDEESFLCEGVKTSLMVNVERVTYSLLLIGFVSYILAILMRELKDLEHGGDFDNHDLVEERRGALMIQNST